MRAEADEMHIQKLSKESREDYANFQTRNERRKKVMNEQIKWEMLNRYKANEVMAQYDKDKKDKAWGKKMLCRKELFDQMVSNISQCQVTTHFIFNLGSR